MSISNECFLNVNTVITPDKIPSCKLFVRATEEAHNCQIPRYAAYQQNKQAGKLNIVLPNCKSASGIEKGSPVLFTRILIRSLLARLRELNNALSSGVINVRLLMVHQILERFRKDLLESRIVVNTREYSTFTVRSRQKNPLNKRNERMHRRLKLFRARIRNESSRSMQILKKWEKCAAPTSESFPLGSANGDELLIHRTDSQNALVKCVQIQKDLLAAVMSLDTLNAKCQILSCREITSRCAN